MKSTLYEILFFLLFLFSLYGCENKFGPPKLDLSSEEIPDQESWNSSVAFSDSGNVKAVLKANHISVYTAKGYTLIDSGAILDFYKDGKKVSTLTGKRGKVIDLTKDIEIYDSVTVISTDNKRLTTDKMYWTNKTQKVSSDSYVKIITPKEEIEGYGFESDQNLTNYTIFKVTGIFSK